MLLCPSANRAKSWTCEHCKNRIKKDVAFCIKCFWTHPEKYDHIAGTYLGTGFDYLGEPTPFWWPSRSSYFGIIDLAGFPKDIYYMYQSEWTDKKVLHIFPHWNWKTGDVIDIWAYYNNADEVELFLNGKSLGVKKKEKDDLHVSWRVIYEPGELTAISRKDGKEVLTRKIQTTGEPVAIRLTADRSNIIATGKDLSFITAEVLDKDGNVVPTAGNLIRFSVEGPALIAGTDNGDPTDITSLKRPERRLFNGKCLVVIQGKKEQGTIKVKAVAEGMRECVIEVGNGK
jgi:beta-galactosidase